jgi:thiamine pyrophosphate-dependent acetolactate synthase large subunit-like protein
MCSVSPTAMAGVRGCHCVAEGLGAYAEQVRTPDQIAPAIRRALQANQHGQNAVLEMLTKEEGAVPKYWRGY